MDWGHVCPQTFYKVIGAFLGPGSGGRDKHKERYTGSDGGTSKTAIANVATNDARCLDQAKNNFEQKQQI